MWRYSFLSQFQMLPIFGAVALFWCLSLTRAQSVLSARKYFKNTETLLCDLLLIVLKYSLYIYQSLEWRTVDLWFVQFKYFVYGYSDSHTSRGLSVKPGLSSVLGRWQTVQPKSDACTACLNYRKLRVKWNSLLSPFRTIFPAYTQRQSTHQCCWCFHYISQEFTFQIILVKINKVKSWESGVS